ncbi:hypothetical protein J4229_02470 [Candidatus Pacearchaeota archaeon]|nr:hypothetical protein [Candidatus Pacearchaeota archaeon]
MKIISRISFIIGIMILSGLMLASAADNTSYQYGMMGSNGQFYPAGGYGGMMNMMAGYGGYGGYSYGMVFFGWLTYILTIILIVAAIYWLINTANRKNSR